MVDAHSRNGGVYPSSNAPVSYPYPTRIGVYGTSPVPIGGLERCLSEALHTPVVVSVEVRSDALPHLTFLVAGLDRDDVDCLDWYSDKIGTLVTRWIGIYTSRRPNLELYFGYWPSRVFFGESLILARLETEFRERTPKTIEQTLFVPSNSECDLVCLARIGVRPVPVDLSTVLIEEIQVSDETLLDIGWSAVRALSILEALTDDSERR